MKKLILIFALIISAMGFSKTGENDLRNNLSDAEIIELITSQINIYEFNNERFQGEIKNVQIIDVQYHDSFPCTLSATVTGNIVIDGVVAAKVTMSASIELDNCLDIATIGVTFLSDLVNAVIDELSNRLK
ncbi:hypothetical protein GN157_05515 [Flavobacterium rakeshii]|uniref:Uncharacterized protein n=1 Tax=Flavobacterium rakeshii TaxID=1038845 RepID=A0A6N8HA36_9FLAO|nr:hypothetical protein [Flavobacterium rakeshii]MUV03162.1 hypothetical protein [Flavobacterium rakeshii]